MHINFAMWRKASWQLIKMDDKKEWDSLDVVSKWLIATRSAVTLVTVYSCVIAGLLAWRDGNFSWLPFIILTLGLFIAHGTNNILNDYTDYSRGVDTDNYFRTQYGVHPLVQGFFTKPQQIQWFKYWGLGELAIFLIWGPIMIGGVYLTMALIKGGDISNVWNVVLAGIPYGLGVASINIGKHIDKHDDDKARGVGTFPVRVGEAFARRVDQAALILIYAVIVYLVFVPRYFTPVMLIVFLAFKHAFNAIKVLNSPRPKQPPQGYPVWPTWFSAVTFFHNRQFGGWLILGLIVDTLLHVIPFTADLIARYWPPM